MSVSIVDVAKLAGVSKATVSKVLNLAEGARVGGTTRERIMRIAAETGYHPNAHASSLSRRRANMIGIVTPQHSGFLGSYFSMLITSIVDTAQQLDQTAALYSGSIWKHSQQHVPIFGDGRCDGLVVISNELIPGLNEALAMTRLPHVMVNGGENLPEVNSIDINNVDAARKVTRFLIEKGHRRIAFLHSNTDAYYSLERLSGYQAVLQEAGIAYDARLVLPGSESAESAMERAIAITSQDDLGATALFCATDKVALWAMHALIKRGIRVPQDISIVGFNDLPEAKMANPSLTTLSQSLRGVGESATRLLMELIDKPDQPARNLIHPTELIVRDSVAEIQSTQLTHLDRKEIGERYGKQ